MFCLLVIYARNLLISIVTKWDPCLGSLRICFYTITTMVQLDIYDVFLSMKTGMMALNLEVLSIRGLMRRLKHQ